MNILNEAANKENVQEYDHISSELANAAALWWGRYILCDDITFSELNKFAHVDYDESFDSLLRISRRASCVDNKIKFNEFVSHLAEIIKNQIPESGAESDLEAFQGVKKASVIPCAFLDQWCRCSLYLYIDEIPHPRSGYCYNQLLSEMSCLLF